MKRITNGLNGSVGDNNCINIYNKIYKIRGENVMFDFDLAEIYGYDTKVFNQQVKRNSEKFDEDFMFRLTRDEVVRSQIVTSRNITLFKGQSGGSRYLPYVFTESGIYMLMTILKGDLATKQSKALIRAFRTMKDYIIANGKGMDYGTELRLFLQAAGGLSDMLRIKNKVDELGNEMEKIANKMDDTVKKSDIAPILLNLKNGISEEYVFLNNELLKASETYIELYRKARCRIIIIDDYMDIRTLRHLQKVEPGVEITIISDNKGNYLHREDYDNFLKEFPWIKIHFKKSLGMVHDRFIVLDYGLSFERVFHCGLSSKDAGKKVGVINVINRGVVFETLNGFILKLLDNKELVLKK